MFDFISCVVMTTKRAFSLTAFAVLMLPQLAWAQSGEKKLVNFARDIVPILKMHCVECHQGDEAKNDFVVLDKEAVLGYVDASGANASSLWVDYLTAPSKAEVPDSLVMPPKGPLSAVELATLKVWLDEGADWPDGLNLDDKPAAPPVKADETAVEKYLAAAGFFHPAVVHFPIALVLFAALAVCLSYVGGGEGARRLAIACFSFGALTTIVSAIAGWGFAAEKGYVDTSIYPAENMSDSAALLYRHRWFGVGAAVLTSIVALAALSSLRKAGQGHFWRLGVIVCALLVAIVGHQGGELVYGDILHKAIERLGWEASAEQTASDQAAPSTEPVSASPVIASVSEESAAAAESSVNSQPND